MNEELDIVYSRPLYETASIYEMDEPSYATDPADCENLYALPV